MYSWPAIYRKHHWYTTPGITPSFCRVQLYVSSNLNTSLVETWNYWIFSLEIPPCSISWRWGSAMCIHVETGFDGAGCCVWWMCRVYSSFCRLHACLQLSEFLESCLSISPDSTWSERKHPLFSSFGWQRRVFTQTCLVLAIHLILKQPWLMQLPSTKGAKTHS